MFTRRDLMKTTLALSAVTAAGQIGFASAAGKLSWKHLPTGEAGFFRAPVLLTGGAEALLIDGGFTYPDGRVTVEAIKATGKKLGVIYVSQSDPDFYFNLKLVKEAFPEAKVIAASETVAAIKGNVEKKLATWGPRLKENGPQTLSDLVIPEAFDGKTLTIEGETLDIIAAEGLANRRYLFSRSLNAVFGGTLVFAGVHVWTADTPTKEMRAAWIATLSKILELKPAVVVPGHMTGASKTDPSSVEFTRAYLIAFEEELSKTKQSAALKTAMEARFPGLGLGVALDIGAKVATGEMNWG
jgi:glyoxylase-like metal-dependent hydrolase (beta-lactamase superfamily II)